MASTVGAGAATGLPVVVCDAGRTEERLPWTTQRRCCGRHLRKPETFDVLIVGAGISGGGSAYHITVQCPGTSFVVIETQESLGGTSPVHAIPAYASTATFIYAEP